MPRTYTDKEIRSMSNGELLRLRAELVQQLRRSRWAGDRSRDGAGKLLLAIDSRLGTEEQRVASASTFLYGRREAERRGLA